MKKQIKKTNRVAKKHESGRSMIEMVGVLAVMGLITAAAFMLITSAMSSQKISRIDDDVSSIVQGVRLLYNTSDNFAGVDDSALKVLGYKDAKNPYGGDYKVATDDTATVLDNNGGYTSGTLYAEARFYITIDGLGENICNTLSSRGWAGGGVVVSTAGTNYVATDCSKTNSTNNVVTIEYSKTDKSSNQ